MFKQKEGGRVTLERDTCAHSGDERERTAATIQRRKRHVIQYQSLTAAISLTTIHFLSLNKRLQFLLRTAFRRQTDICEVGRKRFIHIQRFRGVQAYHYWQVGFAFPDCLIAGRCEARLLLCWRRRCLSAECVASPGMLSYNFHTEFWVKDGGKLRRKELQSDCPSKAQHYMKWSLNDKN